MSNDPIDEMLKKFKASEQQLRVESIRTPIKFMDALSHRHQLWMHDGEGTEAARLHLEIIEAFQQARQKYTQLLKIHENHMEGSRIALTGFEPIQILKLSYNQSRMRAMYRLNRLSKQQLLTE